MSVRKVEAATLSSIMRPRKYQRGSCFGLPLDPAVVAGVVAFIFLGISIVDEADAPFLQPLWNFLITTLDPWVTCRFFAGSIAVFSYIFTCLYFSYKDLIKYEPTKVQKDYWPTYEEMKAVAVPQVCVYLFFLSLSWIEFWVFPQWRLDLPPLAPTMGRLVWECGISFIVGDFLIYWEHRIMHMIPYCRKNIHSVHHEFSAVFSWAGGWVHPLEDMVVVICQVVPSVFIFQIHPLCLWVFSFFWVLCLVDEHSGHDECWSPYKWMPFTGYPLGGGAAPHDIHHYKVHKNYGFVFVIWDHLFNSFEPVSPENVNPFVLPYATHRRTKEEREATLTKQRAYAAGAQVKWD